MCWPARASVAGNAEALLRPVVLGGKLVETLPDVKAARARASAAVAKLPQKFRSLEDAGLYPVERSKDLEALVERTRRNLT